MSTFICIHSKNFTQKCHFGFSENPTNTDSLLEASLTHKVIFETPLNNVFHIEFFYIYIYNNILSPFYYIHRYICRMSCMRARLSLSFRVREKEMFGTSVYNGDYNKLWLPLLRSDCIERKHCAQTNALASMYYKIICFNICMCLYIFYCV